MAFHLELLDDEVVEAISERFPADGGPGHHGQAGGLSFDFDLGAGPGGADLPLMAAPALSLPIDPLLPEIVASLEARPALVIEAPPGAGKTTRVPRALLDAGLARAGEIVVLQPRRLPARLAAERVAEEMGERVGGTVGYTVRFDELLGAAHPLRFVTEGVLTRRLLADPGSRAWRRWCWTSSTSATSPPIWRWRCCGAAGGPAPRAAPVRDVGDPGGRAVRAFLGDCPSVRSEGRRFDVAIEHTEPPTIARWPSR
jgi:ATP-dependent helicase HrpB